MSTQDPRQEQLEEALAQALVAYTNLSTDGIDECVPRLIAAIPAAALPFMVVPSEGIDPALYTSAPDTLDSTRLDWLSEAVESGCVTSCFEMDGGIHLTIEGVGEEPKAYRNQDNLRTAIDAAKGEKKHGYV